MEKDRMLLQKKKFVKVMRRLVTFLGFVLLIWIFGLFILSPLAEFIPSVQSFIGFIILIPVSLLFFRVLPDMKKFSQIVGDALYEKKRKRGEKKPYVHVWYGFWIIVCMVFFIPLLYLIHDVFAGVFLFVGVLFLMVLIFLDFQYVLAFILRFLFPPKSD